ncbi:MAG: alanine racemase [Clostridiales Family XIII bacterium]|jgi:alanine racemase|nr:alanine racemase [Clostridiales Family XIII bacterium]
MRNETRRAAWAEIRLSEIRNNYRAIRALAGDSEIIAAIKADAYGHGAVKVAWELVKEGVDAFGIATLNEAVQLRASGIRTDIVLFGATPRGNVKDLLDLRVIPVITSFEDARLLSEAAERFAPKETVEALISLETGMGRLGFLDDEEGLQAIIAIDDLPHIKIKGWMSHFATSEDPDPTYSLSQIEKFLSFERQLREFGIAPGYRTIANSAAIVNYPQAHFEAVRPGLSLYGLYASERIDKTRLPLSPVMSVKAHIVCLRKTPPGFSVSYGRKFVTSRESLIATLPLGYADGLPRAITGKGRVLVRGAYAPIVGSVCMDQCMADVTDIPGVQEYDEVILMGEQGGLSITAEEIAEKSGTINYEVVTRFGQRLSKVYPQEYA